MPKPDSEVMLGRNALPYFILAVVVVLLDQLTKWLITVNFDYGEILRILPVFNLTLVYNQGAAFSFLSDAGGWQRWFFTAIALIMTIVLSVWITRLSRNQWWLATALALVLGGAVGNVIDRILLGHVVDFIQVHWEQYYFPAFNVADSAITVGAAMLLIDAFILNRKQNSDQA